MQNNEPKVGKLKSLKVMSIQLMRMHRNQLNPRSVSHCDCLLACSLTSTNDLQEAQAADETAVDKLNPTSVSHKTAQFYLTTT